MSETPSKNLGEFALEASRRVHKYLGSLRRHRQRPRKVSCKFYVQSPQWSSIVKSTSE